MTDEALATVRSLMEMMSAVGKAALEGNEEAAEAALDSAALATLTKQNEMLAECRGLLIVALDHWKGIPAWWTERATKAAFPLGRPEPEAAQQ
jgi:hypothetical protein